MSEQTESGAICAVGSLLATLADCECMHCGKCVFGYEGTTQFTRILGDISRKHGKHGDIELLEELARYMSTQCMCEKGTALGSNLADAVAWNRAEIEWHIIRRLCTVGTCEGFMNFCILPDSCNGCDECSDVCEDEAILGKRGLIHIIDQDACTQCGDCVGECGEHAIVKVSDADKPRCPKKPIRCR